MDYPNIKEILKTRRIAVLAVLCAVAVFLLAGGFYNLRRAALPADPSASPGSLYAQNKARFAEQGLAYTEEDEAAWRAQDRARAQRSALTSRVVSVIDLSAGGLLALWSIYLLCRNDVRRSKLAKTAGRYAKALDLGGLPTVLSQIERELDDPVYDTPELTITHHWIIGQQGPTHIPVAIPIRAVTGIYFYYLIRRVRGRRTEFFQMLFNDSFDQPVILQLADKKVMEACFPVLLQCCPHVDSGNYSVEYKAYRELPPKARHDKLQSILQKNTESGL